MALPGKKSRAAQRKVLVSVFVLISLGAAFFHWQSVSKANAIVAAVGDFKITRADALRRFAVIQLDYPMETQVGLGLKQLIHAYALAQILKTYGSPVTPEQLKAEEHRIDETTGAPDQLVRIKAIFGRDHEAYVRDFVLPAYVEAKVPFEFFPGNPKVQAKSLEKPGAFLIEALDRPRNFGKLAATHHLKVDKLLVSPYEGLRVFGKEAREAAQLPESIPLSVRQRLAATRNLQLEMGRLWYHNVIKRLQPGQVHREIIDGRSAWVVARYLRPLKRQTGDYLVEAVAFPKEEYEPWIAREIANIPVIRGPNSL